MKALKKAASFIMVFAIILAAASMVTPVKVNAEENEAITLPEFAFCQMPYSTLEETGIPVDALKEAFDSAVEFTFVEGKLRVKSIGEESFEFRDENNDGLDHELIDGYYYIDYTEEQFENGFYAFFYGEDRNWELYYEGSLTKRFIHLNDYESKYSSALTIYPEDGWGDYVQIFYEVANGVEIIDTYDEGALDDHELRVEINDGDLVIVTYDPDGNITKSRILIENEYYYYSVETGWEEVPAGYEDVDLNFFKELLPSLYNCEHEWQDATCFSPETCIICNAMKGEAVEHNWQTINGKNECVICGTPKIDPIVLPKVSFTGLSPKAKLSDVKLPLSEIEKAVLRDVHVTYDNGELSVIVGKDSYVHVEADGSVYDGEDYDFGRFVFELTEEEYETATILVYTSNEGYFVKTVHDKTGKCTGDYDIEFLGDEESDYAYLGGIEKSSVLDLLTVYYFDDSDETKYSYKDLYLNGKFCEREVTHFIYGDDVDTEVEVRYGAKGEIIYVEIEENGDDFYYNFTNKCWSDGRNYVSPTSAPVIAEGRSIEEIIKLCPSGLDFIKTSNGKAGNPDLGNAIAIVLAAIIVLCGTAFGGYAVGKKKG